MGVDFIRERAKTFEKTWDKRRVELNTPGLFSQAPRCQARTVVATITTQGRQDLRCGDKVTVQMSGGSLVAMMGLSQVARVLDPPKDVLEEIDSGCGVATGTIEEVHDMSGTLEMSLS